MKLVSVTKDNFQTVIGLTLNPEDQKMVNSNLYSLAEAYVNKSMVPRVITVEGKVVGFLMVELQSETSAEIHRVMIDEDEQRKGYAKAGLQLLLDELKHQGIIEVLIAYAPENKKAIPLYESLGFVPTGEKTVDEGTNKEEVVAKLMLIR